MDMNNLYANMHVALCAACKNKHLEIVTYIISLDIRREYHDEAMHFASMMGNLELVKYIVSKGTKVNDYTLHVASQYGHLELVKYFVSKGVNIESQDNKSLRLASTHGNLEVVKYLVSKGANIQAVQNYALRLASGEGHLEVVKYLVSQVKEGYTDALYYAIQGGHLEIVQFLISKGANIRANNCKALQVATRYFNPHIMDYLTNQN
jgi:ankyrin repeat protein